MYSQLDRHAFSVRFRSLIDRKGITLRNAAASLGFSEQQLYRYLNGQLPEPGKLLIMARWGGCTIEWLLTGEGPGSSPLDSSFCGSRAEVPRKPKPQSSSKQKVDKAMLARYWTTFLAFKFLAGEFCLSFAERKFLSGTDLGLRLPIKLEFRLCDEENVNERERRLLRAFYGRDLQALQDFRKELDARGTLCNLEKSGIAASIQALQDFISDRFEGGSSTNPRRVLAAELIRLLTMVDKVSKGIVDATFDDQGKTIPFSNKVLKAAAISVFRSQNEGEGSETTARAGTAWVRSRIDSSR